ncbi:hypothetical protein HPB48_015527 [Haemaphysalis longicornis]|uniref:Uncharacterized protein n=1 Tax=Haemaphysalis longicornis TaxID=44386 RepID=A0A9J6FIB4_HAELO|nr:hypothetical protein HPB48_015527 [Haemaphysalis longicornis]
MGADKRDGFINLFSLLPFFLNARRTGTTRKSTDSLHPPIVFGTADTARTRVSDCSASQGMAHMVFRDEYIGPPGARNDQTARFCVYRAPGDAPPCQATEKSAGPKLRIAKAKSPT